MRNDKDIIESFVMEVDALVEHLSLEDYSAVLLEMRDEINSRIVAVREDLAKAGDM